jgi:ketosteroid isomerase-like protein
MQQNRRFAAAIAACFSIFAFAAPVFADAPQPQTEAAIKAENARWADAFARGDYEAIGRLYTHDGALLPPGGDRVTGGSAIASYFAKQYAGARPDTVSFSNYEFYSSDGMVTEVSDADIRDHAGNLKYRGKQVLLFLKKGGVWKLHRDIWNDYPAKKSDDR